MTTGLPETASRFELGAIIGTAGHVDHGKTSLVRALTGIDTDRLAVEKQRGITTELGFAHFDYGGTRYPVIDVPGHENFVHAMAAGVGGIAAVCMVIAADEGIKPQTKEHLDICRLLGVQRGCVAVTKIDLCPDGLARDALVARLRAQLAASFLADAPIVLVSAQTGEGLPALRDALVQAATANHADMALRHVFRLPIDRVFSLRGTGTVVTGTVHGSTVAVGDEVQIGGHRLRVRGIGQHGVQVQQCSPGQRAALNVAKAGGAIGVDELSRGQVAYHVDALAPVARFDATFEFVAAAARPLGKRTAVMLHHGTAAVPAMLVVVDLDELAPGQRGLVKITVAQPIVALPGDRFIVRGSAVIANFGRTLGGGVVERIATPPYRKRRQVASRGDVGASGAAAPVAEQLIAHLQNAKQHALSLPRLAQLVGLSLANCTDVVAQAPALQRCGQTVTLRERFIYWQAALASDAQVGKQLAKQLHPDVLAALKPTTKPVAAPPSVALSPRGKLVLQRLTTAGLAAPSPSELANALALPPSLVADELHQLSKQGVVVKIKPDYVVEREALASLQAKLQAYFANASLLSPADWKSLCGLTRKHAIPLLEYFDAIKLTLRVGDHRKLRK